MTHRPVLPLPWHGLVKFLITTVVTIGLSPVLYEYCVWYAFIGTQMNGSRSRSVAESVDSGRQVLDGQEEVASVQERADSGGGSPRRSS